MKLNPNIYATIDPMDGEAGLQEVLKWFRAAGGLVGDTDEIPVEISYQSCLFYSGVREEFGAIVEVSGLLHLGKESGEHEEALISEIEDELLEIVPPEIYIDSSFSVGTDLWSVLRLSESDFAPETIGLKMRSFVDFTLRTVDTIQNRLHPREIIQPSEDSDVLEKFDELVGVEELLARAEELLALAKLDKLRSKEGLKTSTHSPHLVFTGNPGTGKTTVARLIGALYKQVGILPRGHLIEARRSDLIGQYVGQTTPKTEAVIKSALGGVLFIDEAYTLAEGKERNFSFGEECIATLLQEMENKRGQFAVIVAGYPDEMTKFINSNPGLRSRFDQTWHFRDYTNEELVTIIERYVTKNEYRLSDGCGEKLLRIFSSIRRDRYFGNARLARQVFHSIKRRQAVRVVRSGLIDKNELIKISPDDIESPESTPPKPPFGFGRR